MGSFEIIISTVIGSSGGDEHCQPGVPKIIPIKMRVNNDAHGLRKHQKMTCTLMDDLIGGKQCKISQTDLKREKQFFAQRFSNLGSSEMLMQLVF